MKWTDCSAGNALFTNDYDRACREIRRVLGSFDRIAQIFYANTGESVAGVSMRRWMKNRTLPVNVAATLITATKEEDPEAKVGIFDFFPYLRPLIEQENPNGFLE